jgi:succinate dehydrogenase hydrophobic anchor subunit
MGGEQPARRSPGRPAGAGRPGTPIAVEEELNSRMIAYPFRLLQCCLMTDCGGALILVAAGRAKDFPQKLGLPARHRGECRDPDGQPDAGFHLLARVPRRRPRLLSSAQSRCSDPVSACYSSSSADGGGWHEGRNSIVQTDSWLYRLLVALAGITLILVVVYIILIQDNRSVQAGINQRQQFINQSIQLGRINDVLIHALAATAVSNNDDKLRELLAKNGITINPTTGAPEREAAPAAGAPTPAGR